MMGPESESPGWIFHQQFQSDDSLVLFRCSECGYVSLSLGSLHGHIEGHQGLLRQLARMLPLVGPDYVGPLMDRTEILRIDDCEEIELSEVEGL